MKGDNEKMRALTKEEAIKALKTQYGRDCLDHNTAEDLLDDTKYMILDDGSLFFTISEFNYKEWLPCDILGM